MDNRVEDKKIGSMEMAIYRTEYSADSIENFTGF